MAQIFPFGEGQTDKVVFDFVKEKLFPDREFQIFAPVGGKNQFRSKIKQTVEAEIFSNRKTNILVFRDIDNGETMDSVSQSFSAIVKELLSQWNLQPDIHVHQQYPNIYICDQRPSVTTPGLRLLLHLANHSAVNLSQRLRNQTTDGYVLAAGLDSVVLERFAQDSKVNSNAETLNLLITQSIPGQFEAPGIVFDEDKDFLTAYLCATRFWVAKRTEDQARLVRIILERAWQHNQNQFKSLFATWQVAIDEAFK